MARPQIIVNGGSPGVKGSVSPGGGVTLTLDSTIGVRSVQWTVLSTDELSSVGDYTLALSGSLGQTATTTALGAGTAFIVRVIVNNGLTRGVADPMGTQSTVKVFVPTAEGLEVAAAGETLESDPVFGSTGIINALVRTVSSVVSTTLGIPFKSALVVSTSNLTLNGAATIDGVTIATNDDVLAVGQTNPAQNGIYVANTAGAWTRSTNFDSQDDIRGAIVAVVLGAAGSGRIYQNSNTGSITVGTTALTFVQMPNRVDKEKVDAATSNPTLNTIAMWDSGAAMHATSFQGQGILPSIGLLRGAYLSTFVGMRNAANSGDVVLMSGKATNGLTLGSDDCEEVELRGRTTGTVTYAASGSGTYLTVSYDAGSTQTSIQALGTLDIVSTAQVVQIESDVFIVTGGFRVDAGAAAFFGSTNYGGGAGVIFIGNSTGIPTSNPTGGGFLYVESGALKYRGTAGTITTIAPA